MTEPAPDRRAPPGLCAIVIGAANGAGEHFARALSDRGAELILVDRDRIALARLRQDLGGTAIPCDVLDERCVTETFDTAEQMFGHVDVLINAAGTGYVRTLGVMRASREFARRPRLGKAFVLNLAASPDSNGPIAYAGSEVAFNRLAKGLAQAIESSDLKVLTLERIADPAAIADLTDQLLRELGDGPSERISGQVPHAGQV